MKFSDYPPERIDEWNADEVTQAYLMRLADEVMAHQVAALAAVRDGQRDRAAMMTGTSDGLTKAMAIATSRAK